MMELAWTMITKPDKLWVRIMKVKYSSGMEVLPSFSFTSNSSNIWKVVVTAWKDVHCNIIWVVRNGHNICFWKDNMIPGVGKLVDLLSPFIPAR